MLPNWLFLFRGRVKPFDPNDDPEAQRLRTALLTEDWPTVEAALNQAKSSSPNDPEEFQWSLRRLTHFEDRPAAYDDWCEAAPDNFFARLLRGAHGIQWAWEARGTAYTADVPAASRKIFQRRLAAAEVDLCRAAELRPDHPAPRVELITVSMALLEPQRTSREWFDEVLAIDPWHYEAHSRYVTANCEKWGGSHEAMFEVARRSRQAPPGSSLPGVIPEAHLEYCTRESAWGDYWQSVRDELRETYQQSIGHPDHASGRCTHYLRNLFAFCFYHTDDRELAHQLCRQINNRPTQHPWELWGDDIASEYRDFRRWANQWIFA